MTKNQVIYLTLLPIIIGAEIVASIGETIRRLPKEIVETLEYLGEERDY